MTSADFSQFVVTMLRFAEGLLLRTCETSPGKNNDLHLIYLPHLQRKVRAVSDFVLSGKLVRLALPSMRFLFVRPRFCPQRYFQTSESGFLQIPPHDGHPCLWLTVPTAKSVADFHRQVVAHAGRTKKKNRTASSGFLHTDKRTAPRQSFFSCARIIEGHGHRAFPINRIVHPCIYCSTNLIVNYLCAG